VTTRRRLDAIEAHVATLPAVVAGEVACPHCGRASPVDDLRDTHPDAPPEAWTAQCPLDEAPEDGRMTRRCAAPST
jgi:hypothetical protein